MITGRVNTELEPIISLYIRHSNGQFVTQEAILDTGFNGWLSLFDLVDSPFTHH
jgi:predicted aspartyl protease